MGMSEITTWEEVAPVGEEPEEVTRVKAALEYARDQAQKWRIRIQRLEIELARLEAGRS